MKAQEKIEPTEDMQIATMVIGLIERATITDFKGIELNGLLTINQWLAQIAQGTKVLSEPEKSEEPAPKKPTKKVSKLNAKGKKG